MKTPNAVAIGMLVGCALTYGASHAGWYWSWHRHSAQCQRDLQEALAIAEDCTEGLSVCEDALEASGTALLEAIRMARDTHEPKN